jgi:hypothetical protein
VSDAEIQALREALAGLTVQVTAHKGMLAKLRREIDTMKGDDSPPGPYALRWTADDDRDRDQLASLSQWYSEVFMKVFPASQLPGCVLDHSESRWELGNMMQLWRFIYTRPKRPKEGKPPELHDPPLPDALTLFDRFMPGVLGRLKIVTRNCMPPSTCSLRERGQRYLPGPSIYGRPDGERLTELAAQGIIIGCLPHSSPTSPSGVRTGIRLHGASRRKSPGCRASAARQGRRQPSTAGGWAM